MHGEGALKELFAKGGYVGRAGAIAPLDVDALALPPDGFSPVPLADLEAKCGRKIVDLLTPSCQKMRQPRNGTRAESEQITRALRYDAPAGI